MGLYLLIPLSVVLVFIIGVIFWWSVRSGQYDDLEGPAYRLLLDDRDAPVKEDAAIEDADPSGEGAGETGSTEEERSDERRGPDR
ncbi:MAG TPA: cbb3-type cytochrome oxidase assembly protein CcoS [Rhodocyclaceae bacterium]|jgi:cbb3-type cytochrome oxidase maturation protein|nr:cbb3-type cytochrome oxidase assembly protein CcoS [Rhodocyclaceae bacterium]